MTSATPTATPHSNDQQQQQHTNQPYQQPHPQPQGQGLNAVQASSPPSKRDLRTWWKNFKIPSKHQEAQESKPQGIFGVPLRQSITYANVAISLIDEDGKSYIYGYVPIVVAKCGVFLKEKATHVEGIFRLSGSEKRIKELKTIFDSPDRYGKGLVWDGYTVHDAANVLRRYLNDLPEPVVPLDLYEKFREPLRGATRQAAGDADGPQFVENFDVNGAIARYQQLITELPPLNRQLLLYLLDLLAVFAAKSDENRMNSQNLAAIFQPGMLSHPNHAMAPEEYRLNQCVIIFLIENQDHFLIGMQGTAADEKTVREVQKGTTPVAKTPATPDPNRRHSIQRSLSNASVGAESVAKEGMIRRNKSVSSRHSRQSNGGRSPGSPAISTTPTGGGLGRSNTVPSKKSPGLQSGRFQNRHDPSSTPIAPLTPVTPHHVAAAPHPPPQVVEEVATPPEEAPLGRQNKLVLGMSTVAADKPEPGFLGPSAAGAITPSRERPLQSLFQRSPTGESEKRAPNKLRKKKLPGSANPSAHSSTASLPHSSTASPTVEAPNPLDSHSPLAMTSPAVEAATQQLAADTTSESTPRASQAPSGSTLHPESAAEHGLRHQMSPPTSLHSSFNEGSDIDQLDEQQGPATSQQQEDKERKRRWRLSRKKEEGPTSIPSTSPRKTLGANLNADMSTSSVGSSGMDKPRRSFTGESSNPTVMSTEALSNTSLTGTDSREGREESGRGLTGWIKSKYREHKETAEQRRNKSPPADRPNTLGPNTLPTRGKSLDISRAGEEGKGQQVQEPRLEQ
ncbi:RhoGAP-domain-containing protein [Coniochaeta ligniaria NRRL 30616]|uniref:RhoGAP-domain-containing protein n=1 Tax=Coniochaeta ligniaria NRRL 30616 TaxID=1408157 RepID=A0A1J7J3U6_9PEZI|nr:RhoGAP-domain-containing protein [Coniochaeta ligniaria NRRL 30616]